MTQAINERHIHRKSCWSFPIHGAYPHENLKKIHPQLLKQICSHRQDKRAWLKKQSS